MVATGTKSGIRTPPPAFPNETEKMKDNDNGPRRERAAAQAQSAATTHLAATEQVATQGQVEVAKPRRKQEGRWRITRRRQLKNKQEPRTWQRQHRRQ